MTTCLRDTISKIERFCARSDFINSPTVPHLHSFSFVEEPQTNGVVERFNRTLKEQAIYGKVFRTLDEVREAVLMSRQEYNRSWRLEKLGFMTPLEARQRYDQRSRQAAA